MMDAKQKKKAALWICIAITILLFAVVLILLACINWGFARPVSQKEAALRQKYVDSAAVWIGSNSRDGSHKEIVDIYNKHTPLAQDYTVKYTDKWCAAFVSTVAIQCGITDRIPTECGCQRQIQLFADLGHWEENDDYIPLPGDLIYYAEADPSGQDNTGWSNHVGIVVGTWGKCIKVIEGNVAGRVAVRYIFAGDPTIRGFALPDYSA